MRGLLLRSRSRREALPALPMTTREVAGSLRAHAVRQAHEVIDQLPVVLRRLGTFLLVASITMAAFAGGLLIVVWHAVN